jgi:hypothetical protein
MSRAFHLGDVLSITTERLVSPNHMDGVHEILDYLTGDTLFTHQLPRAMGECNPALLAQHPQLAEVQVPDDLGDSDDPVAEVAAWLAGQVEQYGETLEVAPLDPADHTRIHPVTELGLMGIGPDRIVTVVVDGDSPKAGQP